MNGLIIFIDNNEYYGIGNFSCLAEYTESKRLGDDISNFADRYINEDTQQIELSPYAIYDLALIRDKISKHYEKCSIIAYCNDDEELSEPQLEFIGYDVCGNDDYTSPIGLDYLSMSADEGEFTDDAQFFYNLDSSVRYEYNDARNDYGLFDSKATADEIAEYCNWLVDEYEDMFFGVTDFRIVKIYIVK